jgi:hypothetical protein
MLAELAPGRAIPEWRPGRAVGIHDMLSPDASIFTVRFCADRWTASKGPARE